MKYSPIHSQSVTMGHHIRTSDQDVWIIGDVHGCYREFRDLCHQIRRLNSQSIIIQLGDLIDRGPGLSQVFDVIEEYNVICTIGNHELNFLMEHDGVKRCNSKARHVNHDRMASYTIGEQDRILSHLRNMYNVIVVDIELKTGEIERWCLSHAPVKGYEQAWPFHGLQSRNAWTYCSRTEPYDETYLHSDDRAAHGHQHWNYIPIEDQIAQILSGERKTLNVDGGCVYGGELAAVNLNSLFALKIGAYESYWKQ